MDEIVAARENAQARLPLLQKTAAHYEKLVLTLECSVEASCEGDCKVDLTDWLVEVWGDGFCRAVKPKSWCLFGVYLSETK